MSDWCPAPEVRKRRAQRLLASLYNVLEAACPQLPRNRLRFLVKTIAEIATASEHEAADLRAVAEEDYSR